MTATQGSGMVLRAAGPGDDAGIRAVIARAFPDNPKSRADILAWQYWDNPFGSTCAWVWEDGDRIVAHYSGYPVPAVVGGRQGVLAIGVDAAVAPDYQGRGLFRPLSAALYEDCAGHGMAGTVCFPNDNSRKGITAAGWVPVGRLRTHVLALDDAWLGRRLHAPDRLAGAARSLAFPAARAGALADPFRGRAAGDRAGSAAEEVPGPPDGLDQLWREVGAGVAYGVARHGSWWRWRYEARPGRAYRYFQARRAGRLAGAAVTTVREAFGARFAYVLELLAANREAARTLTGALAGAAVEDGAVGAALVALPGSGLHELAGEAGFRLLPAVLEPKALWFGVVPTGATRDPGSLAWSLAWGDLDHI